MHHDQVFAPAVKSDTFRVALTLAGVKGYSVHDFDVETASLHGDLTENIYMKQILGFEDENTKLVLKLHKALYSLRQSV